MRLPCKASLTLILPLDGDPSGRSPEEMQKVFLLFCVIVVLGYAVETISVYWSTRPVAANVWLALCVGLSVFGLFYVLYFSGVPFSETPLATLCQLCFY